MKRRIAFLALLAALVVVGSVLRVGRAEDVKLPTPDAPLVLAEGGSVRLAWSLPAKPKFDQVVIYRSPQGSAALAEVARVDASLLQYTDDKVSLGLAYAYRVQVVKGNSGSALSEAASVLVGGTARITFMGGSTDRALFEVMMFSHGRRISAQFVNKPGEQVGDMAYVPELDTVEDFRLGPTLEKISLGVAETRETASDELKDGDGKPMKDLAGNPVIVEFHFPGATREVAVATLKKSDGTSLELKEGEAVTVE